MPKLDNTHIADRLRERLADLKLGKEIAARELRALLNEEQIKAIDDAKKYQQQLRKLVKVRTKEKQQLVGYKAIRDIYIEVYEQAILDIDVVAAFDKKIRAAELRQAKIFMDSYTTAMNNGKTSSEAKAIANNDLTRAKLARIDGQAVRRKNKRDIEIAEMEERIKNKLSITSKNED